MNYMKKILQITLIYSKESWLFAKQSETVKMKQVNFKFLNTFKVIFKTLHLNILRLIPHDNIYTPDVILCHKTKNYNLLQRSYNTTYSLC